jgi:hypothetical protein
LRDRVRRVLLTAGLLLNGAAALLPTMAAVYASVNVLVPQVRSGGIGSVSAGGLGGVVIGALFIGCSLAPHAVAHRLARMAGATPTSWFRRHLRIAAVAIIAGLVVRALAPPLDYGALRDLGSDDAARVYARWWWWERAGIAISALFWIAQGTCVVGTVVVGLRGRLADVPTRPA